MYLKVSYHCKGAAGTVVRTIDQMWSTQVIMCSFRLFDPQ